jgi:hypothetical protein
MKWQKVRRNNRSEGIDEGETDKRMDGKLQRNKRREMETTKSGALDIENDVYLPFCSCMMT